MVNFIQKEDLGPVFTNDDTLAAEGIGVRPASATEAGVVNNEPLQELGGEDKTINGLRIGRGAGGDSRNTALGLDTLGANTTGRDNTAVGQNSLLNNTSANNNTAVGQGALTANETGDNNTAIGRRALTANETGSANTVIGSVAGTANTTGERNAAVGFSALRNATDASFSVAVGAFALQQTISGQNNTAVGSSALREATAGDNNIAVGYNALRDATTGDNNIAIGSLAGQLGQSPFTISTESNRIVMGNNDHTNAYINVPWTVTSDERRKTAIAPVPQGLDFVRKLEPIAFEFRKIAPAGGEDEARVLLDKGDGITRYGFSAQQVRELEGKKPVIADCEDEDFLKLQETYLIPVLVNAIQELTRKVEALEQNQH